MRAWVELLRLPALATVPGDALAGAAAARAATGAGAGSGRQTASAVGASMCLYAAGMALNDWADQEEDAAERPQRPLPSGRVRPAAALAAAAGLTAAGVALAGRAGARAALTAAALAGTVWAYDLGLKRTPAGPAAMGAARGLDLLMGAATTGAIPAGAWRAGGVLACHTAAVTAVSRSEVEGGRSDAPLAALAVTTVLAAGLAAPRRLSAGGATTAGASRPGAGPRTGGGGLPEGAGRMSGGGFGTTGDLPWTRSARWACVLYAAAAGPGYLRAGLNPSGVLTRRAVGGGIRALVPLQAALAARGGAVRTAVGVAVLGAGTSRLGRKVSVT